jgi:hypothetical protein
MNIIGQMLGMASENQMDDINTLMRQQTVLHGLMIYLGVLEEDEPASGKDILILAELFIKKNLEISDE